LRAWRNALGLFCDNPQLSDAGSLRELCENDALSEIESLVDLGVC